MIYVIAHDTLYAIDALVGEFATVAEAEDKIRTLENDPVYEDFEFDISESAPIFLD